MSLMIRAVIWKTGKCVFKFQETEKGINELLHSRQTFHLLLNKKGEKMPAKGGSTLLSLLKKV